MRVFTFGRSIPASTIVVANNTSTLRSQTSCIVFSICSADNWPCKILWFKFVNCFEMIFIHSSSSLILLSTKKTWPPLEISLWIARAIADSSTPPTWVSVSNLFSGGVSILDVSLIPIRDCSSVLGIGVAVNVSLWTWVAKFCSLSFASTPNLCSSSITINFKLLNVTSSLKSLCVPITISTVPSLTPLIISFKSFFFTNLLKCLIFNG